ncbi:uncharacterized protein LOC116213783 [Punica granatum]|uniref:Uncharacterized protein n=2 Tax=Punica granatum TaxID=22663 RepID=A0A218VRZ0_PUNGR|nr:uncharacterized protein LOC116213783 [Punica granatum]OWM62791.1 hypothetical protein CDL15_Pgr020085 [Punica granatum]PKI76792.1 hypothetical protein CRG98_002778 [Punica granatum]
MAGVKRRLHNDSDIRALHKELDEVSCAICMDYPHNAVLLMCSSHDKGCRSYICDTSYRHSNCLDRFKKLKLNSTSSPSSSFSRNSETSNNATDNNNTALSNGSLEALREDSSRDNNSRNNTENVGAQVGGTLERSGSLLVEDSSELKLSMKCPLCRGDVLGWEVVEEARNYLNLKSRSCSRESCSFSGNYQELRRHARRVHPMSRPSDIDPSRERAWRRLEHQRDYGDIVSAIRSAIPGAVVVGDYVIENGDGGRFPSERENGPWWTTFFLFQMIGSMDSGSGSRPRPRPWRRHQSRRFGGGHSQRRMLWGENLLGLQDEDDDEDAEDTDGGTRQYSDGGEDGSPVPRRRRRLVRSRSDEEQ